VTADPSAWDRLLDLVDHLATHPVAPPTSELEVTLAALVSEAVVDRSVDRELHVPDTARWLAGLVAGHRAVRDAHPEIDADTDLAVLRLIITRWLHPARPGR
jgi:hypothetical protein